MRPLVPLGTALLAAVLLPACSAGPAPAAAPAAGAPLQVVGQFEIHGLDPVTAQGTFTRLQVAETLVDAGTDGVLRPGLATSWKASAGSRSWTFTLQEGTRFHDGTPLTAGHVVASLDRVRDQEGSPLATVPWREVRAAGDREVRVDLTEPFGALPAVLAHTSAQVLAPSSYRGDTVTQVIGTGPYRVERVEQPAVVDLAAAPTWRGRPPVVQRVHYQTVGRAEARGLMAESGQADITFGMDPVTLQRVARQDSLEVLGALLPRTILLKANADHPALGDVRVRRAISLALDRSAMATALLRDPELAATQLFPPSLPEWHTPGLTPLQHDPEAARALLTEAGWAPGSDGTLAKGGQRLALSLRTFPDRAELPVVATAVQAALQQVGIAVEVLVGNSSEISAGHEDGSLELALYSRSFSLVPDPLVTLLGDFDEDGAEYGAMGWTSPVLADQLGELADGVDGEAAATARGEVARVLQDELPVVPVAWYRQAAVVGERVEGVVLDPLERSFGLADVRWAG